jgi:hypothetical protein
MNFTPIIITLAVMLSLVGFVMYVIYKSVDDDFWY